MLATPLPPVNQPTSPTIPITTTAAAAATGAEGSSGVQGFQSGAVAGLGANISFQQSLGALEQRRFGFLAGAAKQQGRAAIAAGVKSVFTSN